MDVVHSISQCILSNQTDFTIVLFLDHTVDTGINKKQYP